MYYFCYLLKCADNSIYIGSTNNLKKRIDKHNQGFTAKYTKIRLPVKLVYFEKFATLKEARRREAQIKGWRKEKKINLIKYGRPIIISNN